MELETIVHRAISKNPDERYATAHDFADDLARFCAERPIRAKPPTRVTLALRWAGKHRTGVFAAIVVLLLLFSSTAYVQWRYRIQIEGKNQELEQEQQRTRKTLQFASQAVDDMYSEFADQWLSQQPQLTSTQLNFLGKAAGVYERLIKEFPADYELKARAAHAIVQLL